MPDLDEKLREIRAEFGHASFDDLTDSPTSIYYFSLTIGDVRSLLDRIDADAVTIAEARRVVAEMQERDRQNGFLSDWWKERLDALDAALAHPKSPADA